MSVTITTTDGAAIAPAETPAIRLLLMAAQVGIEGMADADAEGLGFEAETIAEADELLTYLMAHTERD